MNFQAGYIIDGISDIINEEIPNKLFFTSKKNNNKVNALQGLLETASTFSINFKENEVIDYLNINPVLAVQNNILSRGLPTRAPLKIEEIFEKIGLTARDEKKIYEDRFLLADNKLSFTDFFELLHFIKPELNISGEYYSGKLDSNLEWTFLQNSHPVFKQILQCQREFKTLSGRFGGKRRLDFSFTKPYKVYNEVKLDSEYQSIVFEVDGPHHLLKEQIIYDSLRDDKIREADGNVIRFSHFEIAQMTKTPSEYLEEDILEILIKNYQRDHRHDLSKYTLSLLPLAVSRMQKSLLEILIRRPELLEKDHLKICFIERDIPGAAIAVEIFKEFVAHINPLLKNESKLNLPELEVKLLQEDDWLLSEELNCGYLKINWSDFSAEDFDLVIDNSVLLREGIYNFRNTENSNFYTVRSCHYVDNSLENLRLIYCAKSLRYHPLVFRNEDTSYTNDAALYPNITYFLRNIFRKKDFREGQLPIISRALQKLPVIGLLPTGGGKSLTFQIPALMQPCLTVVVDPIKSLMEDQVRVLRDNWIDNITYANSSQTDSEKNKNIVDFKLSSKQIIFVSPERFVIENFRNIVHHIYTTGTGQSLGYCVIDEVHCLSEWGHDFRYDYLMLGENAQKYCYTRDSDASGNTVPVSLIGLTATASFDVLADIERELKIKSSDVAQTTIMIENTIRPELFFRVVKVKQTVDRSEFLLEEMNKFPESYAYFNNKEKLLKSQLHHFTNFDPKDFCKKEDSKIILNADQKLIFHPNDTMLFDETIDRFSSITFCAVKGVKKNTLGEFANKKGVRNTHIKLVENSINATYYHGSGDGDEDDFNLNDNDDKIIQDNFIQFTTGKVPHMVCTKAFGMGIDKDDVRATFHINYSGSLESLVQECGRAGRDKRTSLATIFVNPDDYYAFDYLKLPLFYKGINSFQMYVIKKNLSFSDDRAITKEDFLDKLWSCEFSYEIDGVTRHFTDRMIRDLKEIISKNIDSLIFKKSEDRDIHDYFYNLAYKGPEYEKSHVTNLFNTLEFSRTPNVQQSLRDELAAIENGEINFVLAFSNYRHVRSADNICNLLELKIPNANEKIQKIIQFSDRIEEFWFQMVADKYINLDKVSESVIKEIEAYFFSRRNTTETGRLIYRMHSIGLLKSYTKDYTKKQYHCVLYKSSSIDYYLTKYSEFLRRYQSEVSVEKAINELKTSISFNHSDLVDDIIKIAYNLIDFAMYEIAGKRRRTTNEIKRIMDNMALSEKNDFQNNLYLKEEMYFYFNAKYSKPGYVEKGIDCSLLDDHRSYQNNSMDPFTILKKYLSDDVIKNGTEQNNYKHLIGSCKKITFSLVEKELNRDWLLKLLNAFAMYSTNNLSYRNEANKVIEVGFTKLFDDFDYHGNDYMLISKIFKVYFEKLTSNVSEKNALLLDIDLIKNKLLQTLQLKQVSELLEKYYTVN